MSEMPGPEVEVKERADGEALLARLLVGAKLLTQRLESVEHAGRRGDGVPGAHGRSGENAAECGGRVAVDQNRVLRLVELLETEGEGTLEVFLGVGRAELDRLLVRCHQRRLLAELLGQHLLDGGHVDVEQRRESPRVDDVLHQGAFPRLGEVVVADLGVRHPEEGHVFPVQ
jgi:hypothetical protein